MIRMSVTKLTMLAALLLLAVGCQQQDAAVAPPATSQLLVFGGPILTLDQAKVEATFEAKFEAKVEAMLVEEGVISALGDLIDLQALAPNAVKLDLAGRTAMPGFIDSHVHVRELGMDAIKADLVGTVKVDEMVERLHLKFPTPKPGTWLIGQGWDEGAFASRGYPDRAALDAAFPDNPVYLESLHGFAGFANGLALQAASIDARTPDPEVGQILRRADGAPTGVLLTLAQALVSREVPAADAAQLEQAIIAGLNTMARAGVTSVHEAGMDGRDVTAFTHLAEQGKLPIRVYGMLNGNDAELMQHWFARGPLSRPDGMLAIAAVKVFYDGSLGSRTAMLRAPYSDHPELANPTERITPAAVKALADQAAATGFQMAVHAIGDEGNDRTLTIFEKTLAAYPNQDHRWRIEHAQVVLPDYYQRVAKLGVISSMQSSHAMGDSAWAEDRVGSERIRYAYAWQRVLDNGGRLIINSDLPGEPWTPAETLYFAVNRQKLDGTPAQGWYFGQALSVSQALQAMTLGGAHAAFQEAMIGSLAVGKAADFIIVDNNPLTMAPRELANLQVLATYVAGSKR
ncbi:MAG: amidohydrolase [SAR86 cluster bacterium]